MQSEIRRSDWDEVNVRHNGDTIKYIYRRPPGARHWQPWVVIAPSAIMRRVGVRGLGLYAARSYKRDDYIGMYDGQVVGEYATRAEALSSAEARHLLRRGHDKLITLRRTDGPGVQLVDGERCSAPFVALVNDPRGTALEASCGLTDAGWLRVIQARVPAFDVNKTIEQNAASELRIEYGAPYWDLHELLGKSAEYAIEVD
jgi:hypothetical protein